jgi:coatomer subunit beta'
MCLYTFD